MEKRGAPAFAAEFIGTFLLVLAIGTVVSLTTKLSGGAADLAVVGLLHAFMLAVLVYALGGTSGGHFNTAVTVTLAALRKISPKDALIYIVIQAVAAVLAILVVKAILTDPGRAAGWGVAKPTDLIDGKAVSAFFTEAIGTFILLWAIMAVAVNPHGERALAGLVIGIALGLAVFMFGPVDGGSFNPARWFGPAVVSGTWDAAWAYILGPIVGGLLAGFTYRAVVLDPKHRVGERPVETLD